MAVFIYSILASVALILFSRSQKYYQKTIDAYGKKFAENTFKIMKVCGYLMLIGAVGMLILII